MKKVFFKLPVKSSFNKKGFVPCESRADILQIMRQFPEAALPGWEAIKAQALQGSIQHAWAPGAKI